MKILICIAIITIASITSVGGTCQDPKPAPSPVATETPILSNQL
jgi:hypothetical protein